MFWNALTLQLGYNATLVTIGATLLGIAAGVTGTFLYLRKRALVFTSRWITWAGERMRLLETPCGMHDEQE